MESITEFHEKEPFRYYELEVKCPKCRSENVVIRTENGYFQVVSCGKCGYKK